MLEYRFEKSGNPAVLRFSGELSIDKIVDLRNILLDSLNQTENILIDLEKAGPVDMAFLQLLCSAHRMALKSGKSLSVSSYPGPFMEAIKEAGLGSFTCKDAQWRSKCLWPDTLALPGENL
ncbi:MAG: STAS domain-containing protein [Nitrospiraceae bacterium]|nr:STAS domain-containing protein [Nitrospiraceae bacterium]